MMPDGLLIKLPIFGSVNFVTAEEHCLIKCLMFNQKNIKIDSDREWLKKF